MIEGITVLNNVTVSDFNPVPWLIVLIFLLLVAFIIYMSDELDRRNGIVLWCGMFALALILLVADIRFSKTDAIQCTIDDNVSINEVYDNYDVIGKQGEIWTLKERIEK